MKIALDLPRKCLKWLMSGLVKIYGDGFTEMRFGDEFCDVKVAAVRIVIKLFLHNKQLNEGSDTGDAVMELFYNSWKVRIAVAFLK